MTQQNAWQNHPITIRPEDSNASGPAAGNTTAHLYLKAYRHWKGPKPAGALRLWLEAFRWAGKSGDRSTLLAVLRDPAMRTLERWKRELLLLRADIYCWRWAKALEGLQRFEEKRVELVAGEDSVRRELNELKALAEFGESRKRTGFSVIRLSGTPSADESDAKNEKLCRTLLFIGRKSDAQEVFEDILWSNACAGTLSPEAKALILEEGRTLEVAGAEGFAAIERGAVVEGLTLLFKALRGVSPRSPLLLADRVLLSLLCEERPSFGTPERWQAAEDAALSAPAAPRRTSAFDALIEAKRFLRLRRALRTDDIEALEDALSSEAPTPVERSFLAALAALRGMQSEEPQSALGAARRILALKGSAKNEERTRHILQSAQYALHALGMMQAGEKVFRDLSVTGELNPEARCVTTILSQAIGRLLTPQDIKELNRRVAALAAAHPGVRNPNGLDEAQCAELVSHLRNDFASEDRTDAWWLLLNSVAEQKTCGFSPRERRGVLEHVVREDQRLAPVEARLRRLRLLVLSVEPGAPELPLAAAPRWLKALEKKVGEAIAWRVSQGPAEYLLVKPRARPGKILLVTTNFTQYARKFLHFAPPDFGSVELVLEMPAKRLKKFLQVPDAYTKVLNEALWNFSSCAAEDGGIEQLEYPWITRTDGPNSIVDELPFTMMTTPGLDEHASIPTLPDGTDERVVRFIDIELLRTEELEALNCFGLEELRRVHPEGFFRSSDPKRPVLVAGAKALLSAKDAPELIADRKLAEEFCLADRAVIEEGARIESIVSYFGTDGEGRGEHLLAFRATTLEDPETSRKPDPAKDAVVRLKQIAALEPEVLPVLSEAHRRAFVRSPEGIFLPDEEYEFGDDVDPAVLRPSANVPSGGTGNA